MIDDYRHQFKKSLGQNFLKQRKFAEMLVNTAGLTQTDTVIEIGPGEGVVTDEILLRTANLILVEKDNNLIELLREKYADRVTIVHSDFLEVNLTELVKGKSYKVISSLPYNVSKKIIRILLESQTQPKTMSLIIQREVAQDYAARPPKATLLSNFAGLFAKVKLHEVVPAQAFYPQPKVDGQIITFQDIRPASPEDKALWSIIKQGFSSPRKILAGNLSPYPKDEIKAALKKLGFPETARAAELGLENWRKLKERL